jgi:hypothetical protein
MREFKFSYYTATNVLIIDDTQFTAKMGPFIKKQFSSSDLQYFYHFINKQYQALYMTYNADGKIKKIQLFSNHGETGFTEMMNYLNDKFKSHSLNHLTQDEALKNMHIANPNKWAPPVVFVILAVCITALMFPLLRHCFDSGSASVTIEQFISNPDLGTRNITIKGYPLDVGVKETITSSRSSSRISSTYVPLVSENWKETDPIHVMLEFNELSSSEFDEVLSKNEFTGVIRNVWWEGVSSDNIKFLKEKYNLTFSEKPILIEVTNSVHNDRFILWVWAGTILFILIIVIIVARRMK